MSLSIGKGIKLYQGLSVGTQQIGIVQTRLFTIQNILWSVKWRHVEGEFEGHPQIQAEYDCAQYKNNYWLVLRDDNFAYVYQRLNGFGNFKGDLQNLLVYTYNLQSYNGQKSCLIDAKVDFYRDDHRQITIYNQGNESKFFYKEDSYYQNVIQLALDNQ